MAELSIQQDTGDHSFGSVTPGQTITITIAPEHNGDGEALIEDRRTPEPR